MSRCLIVFAKEPVKGTVKTRLGDVLNESQCLGLYKAFLKDTLKTAGEVDCEKIIMAYQSVNRPSSYLRSIAKGCLFYRQQGKDLGERMINSVQFAKLKGQKKIVIIGSDSPALSPAVIDEAFLKLEGTDIVLGPSLDGGFYLIGLKKPEKKLFAGVRWSSKGVLKETLKNARKAQKKVVLLKRHYDVDDRDSLGLLIKELKEKRNRSVAPWSQKFLKERKLSCAR